MSLCVVLKVANLKVREDKKEGAYFSRAYFIKLLLGKLFYFNHNYNSNNTNYILNIVKENLLN